MTQSGDRIGKFEIIEPLGEGGLGQVFLARDTIIGREVALKVIRRSSLPGPDGPGWFLRESQAASRLNHPSLVMLHEFGEKGGILYQAMEYVAGDDLGTMLKDHPLPPREILELLAQVCDALGHAHQHGVLHRDLKPANIRMAIKSGHPAAKVLDIGLGRPAGADPAGAAAHLAALPYTAPECLRPGKADGRADLFSVGVLLYEALAGTQPFAGATPEAIAQRVLQEDPPPLPPAAFQDISPALQGVLDQALAKDPAKRPATAEALAALLRAARSPSWTADADPVFSAKPDRPRAPQMLAGFAPPKPPSSGAAAKVTGVVVAALVVLGGAAGALYWLRARRHGLPVLGSAPAPTAPAAPATMVPSLVQTQPATPPQAPPTSAPAPAPAAAPAQPQAQAPAPAKAGVASLDDAAAALDKNAQGALPYLEQAVSADPANERAAALRIVALYNLGRFGECSQAIHAARNAGHPLWPMALRNPPLRQMLEQDVKSPTPHLVKRKAAPAPTPAADADPAGQP